MRMEKVAGYGGLTINFIWSDLLCSNIWGTNEPRNKPEAFLFSVFQSFSQANMVNTVNMGASPIYENKS
jgi:hypothetical protein